LKLHKVAFRAKISIKVVSFPFRFFIFIFIFFFFGAEAGLEIRLARKWHDGNARA